MDIKIEVSRKIIHLLSSVIGISIYFLDQSIYVPILLFLSTLFICFDIMRINFKKLNDFYYKYFFIFTRDHEKNQLTGASYLFLGASLVAILFSKKIVVIGLLVMSFSDSLAAIIGIQFGKTKLFDKTLEGSVAFFLTTFLILCRWPCLATSKIVPPPPAPQVLPPTVCLFSAL